MTGINRIARITVAVKDQDEALEWFTDKLGFKKRVDARAPGIRFLTVSPRDQPDVQMILASWFPEHIGKNPPTVLYTDDCRKTYDELRDRGVVAIQAPLRKSYGLEAVFRDLCGNSYALVEPEGGDG